MVQNNQKEIPGRKRNGKEKWEALLVQTKERFSFEQNIQIPQMKTHYRKREVK